MIFFFSTRGGVCTRLAPRLDSAESRKAEILLYWKWRRLLLWRCETPRSSQLGSGPRSHSRPASPPSRPCLQTSALLCASCRVALVSSVQQDWLVCCFSSFLSSSVLLVSTQLWSFYTSNMFSFKQVRSCWTTRTLCLRLSGQLGAWSCPLRHRNPLPPVPYPDTPVWSHWLVRWKGATMGRG